MLNITRKIVSKKTQKRNEWITHGRLAQDCEVAVSMELAVTLWWFTAAPKPLKLQVFWGSPSPQGSYSPYILGDTTRPGRVTCVLVWSKSDRRRLTNSAQTNKQTNKQTDRQTNKQTNRHYENNGHLAVNQKLKWKQRSRWKFCSVSNRYRYAVFTDR